MHHSIILMNLIFCTSNWTPHLMDCLSSLMTNVFLLAKDHEGCSIRGP